ncbi:MAG: cupin domain-containing protein, partial [Sedimentisphaerales bacterium]|nr:cupin domain-containing protein [Sedimentisphaerales bacterium]
RNGDIPKLTTFAMSTFKPGDSTKEHEHPTMYEVFYLTSGKAIFTIAGKEIKVRAGESLVIEPGEKHFQSNPFDLNVSWIYFGIATD